MNKTFDGYLIYVDDRFVFAATSLVDAEAAVARFKVEHPKSKVVYIPREIEMPKMKRYIVPCLQHYPGYELTCAVDLEDLEMETYPWSNCKLDLIRAEECPEDEDTFRKVTNKFFSEFVHRADRKTYKGLTNIEHCYGCGTVQNFKGYCIVCKSEKDEKRPRD
jgi:hypothetical protein